MLHLVPVKKWRIVIHFTHEKRCNFHARVSTNSSGTGSFYLLFLLELII